jgi:hypothetical protein
MSSLFTPYRGCAFTSCNALSLYFVFVRPERVRKISLQILLQFNLTPERVRKISLQILLHFNLTPERVRQNSLKILLQCNIDTLSRRKAWPRSARATAAPARVV